MGQLCCAQVTVKKRVSDPLTTVQRRSVWSRCPHRFCPDGLRFNLISSREENYANTHGYIGIRQLQVSATFTVSNKSHGASGCCLYSLNNFDWDYTRTNSLLLLVVTNIIGPPPSPFSTQLALSSVRRHTRPWKTNKESTKLQGEKHIIKRYSQLHIKASALLLRGRPTGKHTKQELGRP